VLQPERLTVATVSVSVTASGDAQVTITGETLADIETQVQALWEEGYMSAFKRLAEMFKDAPLAGVAAIKAAVPGAEVIADTEVPAPRPQGGGAFPPGF
jgi:hypothetical protein